MVDPIPPREGPCNPEDSLCLQHDKKEQGPAGRGEILSEREALCALLTSLQQSNRRWQIVAFPAMFAFVLLATYGFYLIYSLVEDVDKMADSMYRNMGFIADRMNQVSLNLDALTGSVRDISVNLDDLTGTVTTMNVSMQTISTQLQTMSPMLIAMQGMDQRITSMDASMQSLDSGVGAMTTSVQSMNQQMGAMTVAAQMMTGSVSGLNQNIGRPMNFMNNIMPW